MSDIRIGIILGSTRPGRNGEAVARWVLDQNYSTFMPAPHHDSSATRLFDQLEAWTAALKPLRQR